MPLRIEPNDPTYAEFGESALRGWVRSHPAVARRHYPELPASGHPALAASGAEAVAG